MPFKMSRVAKPRIPNRRQIMPQRPVPQRPVAYHQSKIATLPNELLTLIFLDLIQSAFDSRNLALYRKACVALARSCRHWRDIALSYPFLWSFLLITDISDIRMVTTFLTRSTSVALYICILIQPAFSLESPFMAGLTQITTLLSAHTHRIVELSTREICGEILDIMFAPLRDSHAPKLLRLKIHSPLGCDHPFQSIFSGGLPAIKHLYIYGPPKVPTHSTSLVYLCLRVSWSLPLHELLAILQVCSSLREFSGTVYDAGLKHIPSVASPVMPVVNLPNLKHLVFSSVADIVEEILAHLQFSATTLVNLHFLGPPFVNGGVLQQSSSLRAICNNIQEIEMRMKADDYFTSIELFSSQMLLTWKYRKDLHWAGPHLGITLSTVKHLTIIRIVPGLHVIHWCTFLWLMPQLTSLDYRDAYTEIPPSLFHALRRVNRKRPKWPAVCPALTSLSIASHAIRSPTDTIILDYIDKCCNRRFLAGSVTLSCQINLLPNGLLIAPVVIQVRSELLCFRWSHEMSVTIRGYPISRYNHNGFLDLRMPLNAPVDDSAEEEEVLTILTRGLPSP